MPDGELNAEPLNTSPLNDGQAQGGGGGPVGDADLAAMSSQIIVCDPSWSGAV